ncbi:MAG: isoamylase early set domain-containing protein [Spirochaetales bacterium]|nr:isoamylase early set domain-containing protein [Spirochaetales bacterium]
MLKKAYAKNGATCKVTFSISADESGGAARAAVLGDWNGWDPEALPMKRRADGGFEATAPLATGREYAFRYLLDGERWENDWNADRYDLNPYATADNSIVMV